MKSTYHEHFSNKKIPIPITWIILLLLISLVHVPVAHGEDPFFSIALSKFSNEQDAEKEEAELNNSGHNAFYRKEKNPDKESFEYQVYIEKYNTRDEAEKEALVLKDLELISDFTVKEVRETPQIIPEQNTPPVENNTELLPIPQPTETKEQTLKPDQGAEEKTTAPESSPIINEPVTESPPDTNTTKPEIKSPPAVDTVVNKTEPAPKSEPKAEPEKKVTKPEPVINHDDARLTEASLQVGAFKDEANAAALKIKLKNLGKNAFYRHESSGSKGEFYRLYITGYNSLREAIKDAKALVESGVISSYSRVHSKKPVLSIPSEAVDKEGKIYFIHVSSNKDETNASENVARLKEYGYKAFYVLEKDLSVSWYRVYIGEFKDEADAKKKGMELLDRGLISYFKPLAIDRKKLDSQIQETRK